MYANTYNVDIAIAALRTCEHGFYTYACAQCCSKDYLSKCECGAKALGAKPRTPEHSDWCPVSDRSPGERLK